MAILGGSPLWPRAGWNRAGVGMSLAWYPKGCSLGPLREAEGPAALCTSPTACDCSGRLCDELTGQCICPPRTVLPDCIICQPQTFGCHPLVGCEECNCSRPGVQELTDPTCDEDSGQCK